jgi:hypothetical protein
MSKVTAAGVVASVMLLMTIPIMTIPTMTVVMAQYAPQPARGASPPQETAPAMVLMGPRGLVPVTKRLETTTLHGTIIDVSCFRKMGAATVASPEQVACAKASLAKGDGVAGILTDGVGTFQLGGSLTADNFAKLVPYLGKDVDVTGAEVYISNNFSYHVFEVVRMTPAKMTPAKK